MNASDRWNFRSTASRIMTMLLLAATLGGLGVAPALAGEHHDRGGHYQGGRDEHRGPGHYRGHYRDHYRGRYEGGRVYRPYGYVEPVYIAPPVYYAPPLPAPGVSIFLPTIHIR